MIFEPYMDLNLTSDVLLFGHIQKGLASYSSVGKGPFDLKSSEYFSRLGFVFSGEIFIWSSAK